MRAQHNARFGINIADPDAQANTASGNPLGTSQEENRDLGLRSRKRMQDSYQITSQNDVNRQGGMNDAFLTVRLLLPFLDVPRTAVPFSEWASWF